MLLYFILQSGAAQFSGVFGMETKGNVTYVRCETVSSCIQLGSEHIFYCAKFFAENENTLVGTV